MKKVSKETGIEIDDELKEDDVDELQEDDAESLPMTVSTASTESTVFPKLENRGGNKKYKNNEIFGRNQIRE
jgi:hypothetical protein